MVERPTTQPKKSPRAPTVAGRLFILAGLVGAAVLVYQFFGDQLTLAALAEKESQFRAWQSSRPFLVFGIAFATYTIITGLSLPFAGIMSLAFAWFFGFWPALILISFASTAGATFAFLTSRYLFRDHIQTRFSGRLHAFNAALRAEGAFYLFTLRLIPAVPFVVINIVMGLTPMRVRTYWWVSQLGMLPGTAVYVYAGSRFPDLNTLARQGASGILTPQLVTAFVLLGMFPIIVRRIVGRFRRGRRTGQSSPSTETHTAE